jgi:hypothetical protein
MIGLPNPYVLVAGGAGVLAIAATIFIQSSQIHSWHQAYLKDENTIAVQHQQIIDMTKAQNDQQLKSEDNVTRVVQLPSQSAPIIKIINNTPDGDGCVAPNDPEEVKNAF